MSETATILLICNLVSLACVVGAVFLAYHQVDGWGWLLFVAVLATSVPSSGG